MFFRKCTPVVFVTRSQDCRWLPPLRAHFFGYAPAPLSAAEDHCIVPNWPSNKASPLHFFALELVLSYLGVLHTFTPTPIHPPAVTEVKKTKVLTESREPLDFSCCSMRKQSHPSVQGVTLTGRTQRGCDELARESRGFAS